MQRIQHARCPPQNAYPAPGPARRRGRANRLQNEALAPAMKTCQPPARGDQQQGCARHPSLLCLLCLPGPTPLSAALSHDVPVQGKPIAPPALYSFPVVRVQERAEELTAA